MKLLNLNETDKKLLVGIRDDDLSAFKILYDRYKRKIYYFSMKYLQNSTEAEDLVQIVFINLWEHRKLLDDQQPIKSYLYRSVVNHIYNIFKKRAIRSKYIEYEFNRLENFSNPTYDLVLLHDLEKTIDEIISLLPTQQQKIFILSRSKNYSNEEIAKKMELSVRTVENQIYRTLKVIRKHLELKS